MPPVLVDAFTRNRPARVADGDGAPIPEGGRDTYLASLAGSMRRRGMTMAEIEAALRVINEGRCNPPLDRRDVDRIAWSVARYEPDDDVLDKLAKADIDLDLDTGSEPDEAVFKSAGFNWLDVADALSKPPPPYEWLWTGLIEKREVVWLSGAGKTGKSMLALFLGLHLLNGRDEFLGVPLGKIDSLIYLDAENPEKTVRRRLHLAGVPISVADRLRYGVLRNADLGSERGLEALERAVRDLPGSLLILDSLIGLHNADEDKATEVRRFVTGLRKVAEAHDLTVIGLAHEARAGNTRGSTDWGNAVDGTLRVTVDNTGGTTWRTVKALNRRDGAEVVSERVYTFREGQDPDGARRLLLVQPGEVDKEAQAELEAHNARVQRIMLAVQGEPNISQRRLAEHLGMRHADRPFKRACEAAADLDDGVKAWMDRPKRRTGKAGDPA
jgi:KaiC/GvpD/RAD55 family RecA-like ATPase